MDIKFKTTDELINKTPNSFKNRKADEKDIEKVGNWMFSLSKFLKTSGIPLSNFDFFEKKLGCQLPTEIKVLYSFVGNSADTLENETLKQCNFKLLKVEEFWIEKDVIIKDFYTEENWLKTDILIYATSKSTKNAIYGVDIKNGWSLFHQKDWFWQKDDMPLFKKLTSLYANIIISNKENIIKTKVKGIIGIKRDTKAEKKFEEALARLPDFEFYEHTIFLNEELDLIGWFRAGNMVDFLVGSSNKDSLNYIIEKFDFTSAKFLKEKN